MNTSSTPLRVVFMGTPDFAVASLMALLDSGVQIVGVVTAPDKPGGRGMQLQQSAVKQFAVSRHLPVLQPEKLKNPAFLNQLKALNADLQVVVAFRMLPELVWAMPPLGTINLHASLLPNYRGAAPINWAIIMGEKQTGVTTFKLQHEIDTGALLQSEAVTIPDTMNAGELHDLLKTIGAKLLVKTVHSIAAGTAQPIPQPNLPNLQHAPKIFTETTIINWQKPIVQIYNLIRGLAPYPGAITELNGKQLKIFSGLPIQGNFSKSPGTMETDGKHYLHYYAPDGYLSVLELQLAGKRRMDVKEFLRGYRIH